MTASIKWTKLEADLTAAKPGSAQHERLLRAALALATDHGDQTRVRRFRRLLRDESRPALDWERIVR